MARVLIDTTSPTPIWSQIEDAVRRLVAAGALRAGEGLPSVRECAADLKVNPATVSKAYQRLVDAGLLEVRRGEGTFVAARPPVSRRSERQRDLRDAAVRFVTVAVPLGATREEAVEALEGAWRDVAKKVESR